jgi:hypothetical protein
MNATELSFRLPYPTLRPSLLYGSDDNSDMGYAFGGRYVVAFLVLDNPLQFVMLFLRDWNCEAMRCRQFGLCCNIFSFAAAPPRISRTHTPHCVASSNSCYNTLLDDVGSESLEMSRAFGFVERIGVITRTGRFRKDMACFLVKEGSS